MKISKNIKCNKYGKFKMDITYCKECKLKYIRMSSEGLSYCKSCGSYNLKTVKI